MKSRSIFYSLLVTALVTPLAISPLQAGDSFSLQRDGREVAMEQLEGKLRPGSLIFHEGCCLAVKMYTQSPYTHVGILLPGKQGGWDVYDSASEDGTRRTNLDTYLQECAPESVTFCHPTSALSKQQQQNLRSELERQLGRPYSIRHYLTGSEADGMHCSEFVTRSLMAIDVLHANRPSRVSPASLLSGIEESEVYAAADVLVIEKILEPVPEPDSWYARMWADTKACTAACCRSWNRSILCRD